MENSKGKILVVDDDLQLRSICRRSLEKAGFDVQTAETGDQALPLVERCDYDFVLTDISMPGSMDGPKLVEEIRQRCPATDIAIMTGYPTLDTAITTLKHGAYDYLLKPFSLEYLDSVVKRCFEKRRLAKELDREKSLRQEVEAAYSEIQKVERLKDAFLSRLQHELRTPLVSIVGVTDLIAEGSSGISGSGKLKEILRSGTAKIREVVEQLLLFSDTQSSEFKVKKNDVNLEKTIKELIENYHALWDEKELKIEVLFASLIQPVPGDADLLRTAFKHLLLNAINFNKKGGSIKIQTRQDAKEIHITFSDTGPGIPENQISKVFDSFYQAAEYMTRKTGGLGLGLAIVRRIVEAHGGRVSVMSHEGSGSTFTISLPTNPLLNPD
ncbi:MAG: ATP-binding protein [bacterium]